MSEQNEESRKELVYVRPVADFPRSEDDEISLVDLWLVLVRRKWLVLGVTVLCLVLGLGYALMRPVQYEYRTIVNLAEIHEGPDSEGLKPLTSVEAAVGLLRDVIIPEQRRAKFGGEEKGPRIQVSQLKGNHSLMLATASTPDKSDAVKSFHETVAEALSGQHAPLLEKAVEIRVKPFQRRKEILQQQIETLEEQLTRLSSRSDSVTGISRLVDAQQMGDIREDLADARVKITDAQSAVEVIRDASSSTRISHLAVESEDPVGTSKSLITALSLVLGLMLGVFAAFFAEFLANAQAAARERG